MSNRRYAALVVALSAWLWAAPALLARQDMPGAKDHPAVRRFAGSIIIGHVVRDFDAVDFQTSTFKALDAARNLRVYAKPPLHLEGKLTRIWYEAAGATTSLEIFRNYLNDLSSQGFTTLYDSSREPSPGDWYAFLSTLGRHDAIDNLRTHYVFTAGWKGQPRAATLQRDGLYVRLTAVEWPADDKQYEARKGAYMAVDVVETKPMTAKMVVVSAAEIAAGMAAGGRVAVYGILFDSGKADVRQESTPALDQIAAYLKATPSAKIHVVGHTDNVGALQANTELSSRRAEAVVAALASRYGVVPARMSAHGVGPLAPVASNATEDGRARNRRVELVIQ